MTIQDQITTAANAAGVPPGLALAIAQQESGFNQNAVGTSGEIGVFQLLPSTAASLGVDPTDLVQNISGGVAYLAGMLRQFGGDPQKAAAAYNCGPGCVSSAIAKYGANWYAGIPGSTQEYVANVAGVPSGGVSASSSVLPLPPAPLPVPGAPAAVDWQPWAWGLGALVGVLILRDVVS